MGAFILKYSVDGYFIPPICNLLVPLCRNIHPNWITLLCMLAKVWVVLAIWDRILLDVFVASILERILDCLDGEVARHYQKCSKWGHCLDKYSDVLFRFAQTSMALQLAFEANNINTTSIIDMAGSNYGTTSSNTTTTSSNTTTTGSSNEILDFTFVQYLAKFGFFCLGVGLPGCFMLDGYRGFLVNDSAVYGGIAIYVEENATLLAPTIAILLYILGYNSTYFSGAGVNLLGYQDLMNCMFIYFPPLLLCLTLLSSIVSTAMFMKYESVETYAGAFYSPYDLCEVILKKKKPSLEKMCEVIRKNRVWKNPGFY